MGTQMEAGIQEFQKAIEKGRERVNRRREPKTARLK